MIGIDFIKEKLAKLGNIILKKDVPVKGRLESKVSDKFNFIKTSDSIDEIIDNLISELNEIDNNAEEVENDIKKEKEVPNLPEFVSQLDKDVLPAVSPTIEIPVPVDSVGTILDKSLQELVSMDIDDVRSTLMNEIRSLADKPVAFRNEQLQRIFRRLISFQPSNENEARKYMEYEQRFYIDLISTEGLADIPYVQDFLKNDFYVNINSDYYKKNLLISIFNYYGTHSKEAVEKFNYILRSSSSVAGVLLESEMDLEKFFSERAMASFSKEDLSQLFRFYFIANPNSLEMLFSEQNSKALFMLSQLTSKVNMTIGHSAEFLDSALNLFFKNDRLSSLLSDAYDYMVVIEEDEAAFSKCFLSGNDKVLGDAGVILQAISNYIVHSKYDTGILASDLRYCSTVDDFLIVHSNDKERRLRFIFANGAADKIANGTFDPEKDFSEIKTETSLDYFKESLLYNIYGISLEEAKHLVTHYGQYMDALDKSIIPKDKPILEMLKAIREVCTLDFYAPDFQDKLRKLQEGYLMVVKEKGLDFQHGFASATIVEGLCNRMIMNTYNNRLKQVTSDTPILGVDDGVPLLDAGVEFDMMLSSLSGVDNFFDVDVNMASKWNTASLSRGQGLCATYISSQNLGVINFDTPLLGFSDIPQDALATMGTSDVWTQIDVYNLRNYNDSRQGSNRMFIPANAMADESRYGYNEFLLDRFLMSDRDGKIKLQPTYIVFYKFDEDFQKTDMYKNSLKIAKEFGIPIMVVDVKKIKEHERTELREMEERLLSSDSVDPDLLNEIVTRNMNNYTGSLTMVGQFSGRGIYTEDFSVSEMRSFFGKLADKISSIEDHEERLRWIEALESSYESEKNKYDRARSVLVYKYSVTDFVLDKSEIGIDLGRKLHDLKRIHFNLTNGLDRDYDATEELTEELDPFDRDEQFRNDAQSVSHHFESVPLEDGTFGLFIDSEKLSPAVKTVFDFMRELGVGSKFEALPYSIDGENGMVVSSSESEDDEIILVENLVVAYFFENYYAAIVEDIILDHMAPDYILFQSTTGSDFTSEIEQAELYEDIINPNSESYIPLSPEKVEVFVSKIEEMDDKKFLQIFEPVIKSKVESSNQSYEEIAEQLLAKKQNIRENFNKLQVALQAKANNGAVVASEDEGPKTR